MVALGVTSIVLGIITAFLVFCGGAYVGDLIYSRIQRKRGEYSINLDISGLGSERDLVVQRIINEMNLSGSSGILGKTVVIKGQKVMPICTCLCDATSGLSIRSYKIIFITAHGTIGAVKITKEEYENLVKVNSSSKPVRSREVRRDLRDFCENYCIQDCTDCVLRSYGKVSKAK